MAEIRLIAWDIGGVLLTNAWDTADRQAAAERFGLDGAELERRHHALLDPLERGRLSFDDYLTRLVFDRPRSFDRAKFRDFVFSRSAPHPDVIEVARTIARSGRYLTVTLNNEGRELNEYRIDRFGLSGVASAFLSSCYTGYRKPEPAAYRHLLDVLHRRPEEVVFVDDREENIRGAESVGIPSVQFTGIGPLQQAFARWGVVWDGALGGH